MRRRFLLSLFLSLFTLSFHVKAQQRSDPAPASQPINTESDDSKEPYVVESLQHDLRFEADGRVQKDLVLRIRIQSESAVREFGLLAYPFASSFESLDILYVRVRKPDGTVLETPPGDVQEVDTAVSREAPMYTDQREKHIAVKSLAVGDTLEAQLRWTTHDPMAPGHFWLDRSYFRAGICLKETVRIDVPASLAVKLRNGDPQPEVQEHDGRRIYTFKSSNLKKAEEPKIPEWETNFHGAPPDDIQVSSFTSWGDVGAWYGSLQQSKVTVTPEIRAKAEELIKGKTTDDEKLRAIYDFVSTRFRYIGIDLGLGRYAPHSAADVLVNRYGDCKDKHTLLASLLQAVGIKSYPALVSTKYRIDPSFPTMSLFDHVITAVPQGDAFLFLDTTLEVAPFGLLSSVTRDRQVLVITDSSPAHLVLSPAEPPFPNYEHAKIDASIDTHGVLDAKIRFEDRGDSELVLRAAFRSVPQNKWQELTQVLIARMGFGGTVSDVSVDQPEDTSHPFSFSFSYHRTGYPDWENHRIVMPSPPLFLPTLTEPQKASKEPLPLGPLGDVIYDATVRFPKGYTAIPPPKVERKSDFAEFSATYTQADGAIHGVVHFKTLLHEVPGTERSLFAGLAKSAEDTYGRYIAVFGPGGSSLSADDQIALFGKPEAAIPVLEKRHSENPENSLVVHRLAGAYRQAGRLKDAVDLLQKTLEKNPEDAGQFQYELGETYLALHDGENAFAQFQKSLGDAPKPAQLNNVAYALASANVKLKEALDYSTRAVAAESSETMAVVAEDAKPADFARMNELAAAWDTLGWIQFRMNDLARAQKYVEASWELSQDAAAGEHLVEIYEKTGRKAKAASICNMAQASFENHTVVPNPELKDKLADEMKRLAPYLNASASAVSAKPNGHVALVDMRGFKIPRSFKQGANFADAYFVVSLTNDSKPPQLVFFTGAEELRHAILALQAAKFPQSFAEETPTRILRKFKLSCSTYSKDCDVFLTPLDEAANDRTPGTPVFLPQDNLPQ